MEVEKLNVKKKEGFALAPWLWDGLLSQRAGKV